MKYYYVCPNCKHENVFSLRLADTVDIICSKCKYQFSAAGTYKGMGVMMNRYETEEHGNQGRMRNGSPIFYALLQKMAEVHDKKSHDYARDGDPFANYHFSGMMSQLFTNSDDAGFVGRIGEKLYRLANLENNNKSPKNESVEDTEDDLCVIMTLWVADRRTRRMKNTKSATPLESIGSVHNTSGPSGGQQYKQGPPQDDNKVPERGYSHD